MTRPKFIPVRGNQLQGEIEKRQRLKAEHAAPLREPLNPEVRLSKREIRQAAERVRRGLYGQSFHALGGSVGTKAGEP